MIDYLFPIFGFGVVITGIVIKGLITAHEIAQSEANRRASTEALAQNGPA